MVPQTVSRTNLFRWNSRYELYTYFKRNYGIDRKMIDDEIHRVMPQFKPRTGQAIKTQELWQKVGLILEKRFAHRLKLSPADPIRVDLGITDSIMVNENDPNGTRRVPIYNRKKEKKVAEIPTIVFTKKNVNFKLPRFRRRVP